MVCLSIGGLGIYGICGFYKYICYFPSSDKRKYIQTHSMLFHRNWLAAQCEIFGKLG